jgi:hypothetical protein
MQKGEDTYSVGPLRKSIVIEISPYYGPQLSRCLLQPQLRTKKDPVSETEAGLSSQNDDHALGVYYRRAPFSCALLWEKGLTTKGIHKEIVLVYNGKCLSHKAFHD